MESDGCSGGQRCRSAASRPQMDGLRCMGKEPFDSPLPTQPHFRNGRIMQVRMHHVDVGTSIGHRVAVQIDLPAAEDPFRHVLRQLHRAGAEYGRP